MKKSKFIKFDFENDDKSMVLRSDAIRKYSRSIATDQIGISNVYVNMQKWTPATEIPKFKKMLGKHSKVE